MKAPTCRLNFCSPRFSFRSLNLFNGKTISEVYQGRFQKRQSNRAEYTFTDSGTALVESINN